MAADGLAGFDIASNPTVEFVNGKAVMTVGTNKVAELSMTEGGQLAVELVKPTDDPLKSLTENELPVTVTSAGYDTLYSPFQFSVPSEGAVKVYAPTYDSYTHNINCNSTTEMAAEAVLPVGTGVILKNAGDITFVLSANASTNTHTSALSGSALAIAVPTVASGSVVYTYGLVCLVTAGSRDGSTINGSAGCYWLATPYEEKVYDAHCLSFYALTSSTEVDPLGFTDRSYGFSIRLVK